MPGFVNYKKGCTRLAAASDKVYQLLAHGQWFSQDTPASSTTKSGGHDIAESGVKHQKSINQSSLLAATRYEGNPDRNIRSTDLLHILHLQVQRPAGSESGCVKSGVTCLSMDCCFSELAL